MNRKVLARADSGRRREVGPFVSIEDLPKWLLCIPLVTQWLWLGLKYGSVTLPSTVNPALETGGLAGESKIAGLDCIGLRYRRWVAFSSLVRPGDDVEEVRRNSGITFPLIAKPDIGWCGYGVRRIEDETALSEYAKAFPHADFIIQTFISAPFEAGIFYVHHPSEEKGRIYSLTLRHQPEVVGDGVKTLDELLKDSRFSPHHESLYRQGLGPEKLKRVAASGERVPLTTIASLRVGARYQEAGRLITPRLEETMDAIARSMNGFHFGRFDVRFSSIEALRDGRFTIIEVNGAGSEAIQNWDRRFSIWMAFCGVFDKQRLLFKLADEMRRRGKKPISINALAKAWWRQQRLIRDYPPSN